MMWNADNVMQDSAGRASRLGWSTCKLLIGGTIYKILNIGDACLNGENLVLPMGNRYLEEVLEGNEEKLVEEDRRKTQGVEKEFKGE
jgi:hypothetical protein